MSSGPPAEGRRAKQNPPLRQGLPSQGSGRGVAWVGVGSAGAGVSGASWNGEGTAPMLLLLLPLVRSRTVRSRGDVKLPAFFVGRQQGTAGTLNTLILILILLVWFSFLFFVCGGVGVRGKRLCVSFASLLRAAAPVDRAQQQLRGV